MFCHFLDFCGIVWKGLQAYITAWWSFCVLVIVNGTINTLDCHQFNYSSHNVYSNTPTLNLVKPELPPFDPPTSKTPP